MDKIINTGIFIGIITIIIIVWTCYRQSVNNNNNFKNIKWTESDVTTHIIVTRYKEENIIDMLLPIINKKNVSIYIYNKGDEMNKEEFEGINNIEIIKIRNIGWDSYPYIKHVIDNYNNLPDYIYLVHASVIYLDHKRKLYIELINKSKELNKNKDYYYGGETLYVPLNFTIDKHYAATNLNKLNHKMEISKIRPLQKWIKTKIDKIPEDLKIQNTIKANYFGMFMVSKNNILKYNKFWYKEILYEISVWQSEVNHYLERSWFLFYT
jgi:hypothetical protein